MSFAGKMPALPGGTDYLALWVSMCYKAIFMNKNIVELNHVALLVSDVKRSCDFYGEVLGLEPMARPAFDFPGAWFRLGSVQELHLIGGMPVARGTEQPRGNHFALRVEDLEAWRQFLQPLGLI